jgi:hypothetical protein
MSEQRPQSTTLFRTSLRNWQANYRAKQAETSPEGSIPVASLTNGPTRVKKLTPYKKRRLQRQAAARQA